MNDIRDEESVFQKNNETNQEEISHKPQKPRLEKIALKIVLAWIGFLFLRCILYAITPDSLVGFLERSSMVVLLIFLFLLFISFILSFVSLFRKESNKKIAVLCLITTLVVIPICEIAFFISCSYILSDAVYPPKNIDANELFKIVLPTEIDTISEFPYDKIFRVAPSAYEVKERILIMHQDHKDNEFDPRRDDIVISLYADPKSARSEFEYYMKSKLGSSRNLIFKHEGEGNNQYYITNIKQQRWQFTAHGGGGLSSIKDFTVVFLKQNLVIEISNDSDKSDYSKAINDDISFVSTLLQKKINQ